MTAKQKQLILCCFDLMTPEAVDGIWGRQSMTATRRLQHGLGIQEDGDFGRDTLRAALERLASGESLDLDEEIIVPSTGTFWDKCPNFTEQEFWCKCGQYHAPYCDGKPHEIQPLLVMICQRARNHFGVPIEIISGLRCQQHNADSSGVANSQHMYGEAADVRAYGVSQQTLLDWFLAQPDVRYAYAISGSQNVHFDIQPIGR